VNGFAIDRERVGASVYWHAIRVDADDYQVAAYRNCGSKAAAIAAAEAHEELTVDEWLKRANALLHRTQSDPDPVTSVTYALARLRNYGAEGLALRRLAPKESIQ
jgi:hypothetical protein